MCDITQTYSFVSFNKNHENRACLPEAYSTKFIVKAQNIPISRLSNSKVRNIVPADLVLLDAKIITMNPKQPTADAVAVKNKKIFVVGSMENVAKTIGKNTKIIRLNGKTVIPGIIDTHIHVADFGRILNWLNLESIESIKELQNCLSQRVKTTSKGRWIIGRGWDEANFTEKRLPTLSDLDVVSPNNPMVLYHSSGQICVINNKAAELADINKQSANGIERNQAGEFTGILRNDATNLVWNIIPQPDEQEMFESSMLALEQIAEAGITSIHWLPLCPDEVKVIQALNQKNKLPIRIDVIIPANLFDEIHKMALGENSKGGMLKFGGFELFADGYLASRTAALFEPYDDCQSKTGQLLCLQENMTLTAEKITAAGFQFVIHAVGDKAVDTALNVIEKIRGDNAEKKLHCRIEQAAVLTEKLVERMKKLEVTVSVQPRVISSEFSIWSAINHLGEERARLLFPLKTLLDAGIFVAGGSDCPMEPLNPLLGIQEAVMREPFAEQRLNVEEALRIYTINAAFISSEEDDKGSIEVGKLADFTILSEDPLTAKLDKIASIMVEMSIIGGEVIFSK